MSEAHLALMTKLEELDAYTHTVLHQFPRLERHLLCAEMRAAMNKLLRLMGEIEQSISDADVLWLWREATAAYGHDNGVGVPVGALTSQLDANILLNRLDHVAKDDMGLKHYTRYMDDFIAILPNKAEAARVMCALEATVNGLGLQLNPKTAIHPWQRGLDFCGYRIWPTHILPRKRNIKRARLSFRKMATQFHDGKIDYAYARQRVMSFIAYAKHCDAHRTVDGVLGDFVLIRPSYGCSD